MLPPCFATLIITNPFFLPDMKTKRSLVIKTLQIRKLQACSPDSCSLCGMSFSLSLSLVSNPLRFFQCVLISAWYSTALTPSHTPCSYHSKPGGPNSCQRPAPPYLHSAYNRLNTAKRLVAPSPMGCMLWVFPLMHNDLTLQQARVWSKLQISYRI